MESTQLADPKANYYIQYHVPYSQVWANSGGGQSGNVHLHVPCPSDYAERKPTVLTAVTGRATTITRPPGATLCGKKYGWMEREPHESEQLDRCSRCSTLAIRYGVEWPA